MCSNFFYFNVDTYKIFTLGSVSVIFAVSVANEAYYSLLNEYTDDITSGKGSPILLIADVKACREYNMVWELANK